MSEGYQSDVEDETLSNADVVTKYKSAADIVNSESHMPPRWHAVPHDTLAMPMTGPSIPAPGWLLQRLWRR